MKRKLVFVDEQSFAGFYYLDFPLIHRSPILNQHDF